MTSTRAPSHAAGELGGYPGMTVQGEHLLHFELRDRHGVGGQAERFTACGKDDLGERRGRQDGLAVATLWSASHGHMSVPTSACQTWSRPEGSSMCAPSNGWCR